MYKLCTLDERQFHLIRILELSFGNVMAYSYPDYNEPISVHGFGIRIFQSDCLYIGRERVAAEWGTAFRI